MRVGPALALLINGVFGDPLLHLRLRQERRSLLFDLGDPGRLSARVAHQVSDVFVSHTHADHIGGFLWFLRARIGNLPPCRFYGPPGLAAQIAGMVDGILWDRIEDRGPCFEIREWHGDHIRCFRVAAGEGAAQRLEDMPLDGGILWRDSDFVPQQQHVPVILFGIGGEYSAQAVAADQPVLAYAWESAVTLKVRRERLEQMGLTHGRWLLVLKEARAGGRLDEIIITPDGAEHGRSWGWQLSTVAIHRPLARAAL